MGESCQRTHDVLIIGGGPCGFAVAARLREHTPSALFTDDEHNRYHWIAKHAKRAAIVGHKTGKVRNSTATLSSPSTSSGSGSGGSNSHNASRREGYRRDGPSMLVLDSTAADWLAKWHKLFSMLEIQHLRSPMFFHPDPQDRDGLLAFTHSSGRARELVEIGGCVGQEISKHKRKKRAKCSSAQHQLRKSAPPLEINERDREDYFTPGVQLFRDYCDCVAGRYGLCKSQDDGLVKHETVLDVIWHAERRVFVVQSNKSTYLARAVVLAVGAGNAPTIPAPFPQTKLENACHAFQIPAACLGTINKTNHRVQTKVLVIGGGLTSAQVADRAIRQGNGRTKVWHVMRGPLKLKPFDVDLAWMSKFRNVDKGAFWSCDTDAERMEQIKAARGGGSIPPRFDRLLKQHIRRGELVQLCNTVVMSQHYDGQTKQWTVTLGSLSASPDAEPTAATDAEEEDTSKVLKFDHIYFATGVQSDLSKLPCLQTMLDTHQIETVEGLPVITDDLQWSTHVPLFVTGKFAALRLGPGAGNLEGARVGAERIAWAVQEMLETRRKERRWGSDASLGLSGEEDDEEDDLMNDELYRYACGIDNRFASLSFADSD